MNVLYLQLDSFPEGVLYCVSKLCKLCVPKQEGSQLLIELKEFADQYNGFIPVAITEDEKEKELDEDGSECEEQKERLHAYCVVKKQCFQCLSCAFSVLFELSQSGLSTNLYVVYKFILAIHCIQVTCERVFYKLKILKDRLRSTLGQELMSGLLFLQVKRDLSPKLYGNKVIDEIAKTSEEQNRNLLC